MIIYKITNDINSCIYVGQTVKPIEVRFKEHCNCGKNYDEYATRHQSKLYKAMNKYGVEHFHIEQIDVATSLEELDEKEKYWIDKLDCINSGYNISPGGEGGSLFKGHHHSTETKNILSTQRKGISQDKDFAYRRCEKHKKRVLCLETKEIFDSKKSAEGIYGSSVGDSIHSGRKCKGYHFIYLPINVDVNDDFIQGELDRIEKISNERRLNAHKKTEEWWASRTEEELVRIRKKSLDNFKKYLNDRTEEEKKALSMKLSKSSKGRKFSDETKEKIGKSSKGRNTNKKWYNNGVIQILRYKGDAPDGFVGGMLSNGRKSNK